jgi:carbamoyltransferase
MISLGLSFGFHDATAALAKDGVLLGSLAEERLSRQKHDANFPALAINALLKDNGVNLADIDRIVLHENPAHAFTRVLTSTLANFPNTRREFAAAMKAWLGGKLWVERSVAQRLKISPQKIHTLSHHDSHAYQAFLGSKFDDACVVTVDAVGEWTTTSIRHMRRTTDGITNTMLSESSYPHSLGLFYSAMTAYLGFRPMDGECSVMALAAFGKPRYLSALREIVTLDDSCVVHLDERFFRFNEFYKTAYTEDLEKVLGEPRQPSEALPFVAFGKPSEAISDSAERFADIAASTQALFEELLVKIARYGLRRSGAKNLCLAGGGALNCVATTRVWRELAIDNFYIPPDPGDGGAAVGAALYGTYSPTQRATNSAAYQPYTGPKSQPGEELDFLDLLETKHAERYRKLGNDKRASYSYQSTIYSSTDELCTAVAEHIAAGKIVGWVQGGAESGPRALGARSILIRPDLPELANRLSTAVKDRAKFRPYALSLHESAVETILAEFPAKMTPGQWMQMALPVLRSAQCKVVAGLHIDGTTRPHVVSELTLPLYAKLLTKVGEHTGLAAVVNTSFNESGMPIVHGPIDALAMFARTAMDVLVVNNTVIVKESTCKDG